MDVIIPAAGYATRLYPLTIDRPKHLLEVCGKPIVEHIFVKLEPLKPENVYLITNDKFYQNFVNWAEVFKNKHNKHNAKLEIINDKTKSNDDRLGQIGDIMLAVQRIKDKDTLIIAGDNLFNFSLADAYTLFAKKQKPVNAAYNIGSKRLAKELGVIEINSRGKIISFEEKPNEPKSTLVSVGIYFFSGKDLKLISEYLSLGLNADKMGYFMKWLISRRDVYAHVYKQKWFDIGVPEALDDARKSFKP